MYVFVINDLEKYKLNYTLFLIFYTINSFAQLFNLRGRYTRCVVSVLQVHKIAKRSIHGVSRVLLSIKFAM